MEITPEQMIDAAEVLSALRKELAAEMPHGTTTAHTNQMNVTYDAERILRARAGRVTVGLDMANRVEPVYVQMVGRGTRPVVAHARRDVSRG